MRTGCAQVAQQSRGPHKKASPHAVLGVRIWYVYGAVRLSPRRVRPAADTQSYSHVEKMDPNPARGFAPHPGNTGWGGAIRQSSADAADVDRSGQRDVLERAKAPAPLPMDRSAADS